jgi:predicted alpha/beta-hydrolase family hydrolase
VKTSEPLSFSVACDPDERVTALAYPAPKAFATLILGHGAGADQRHPFMIGMARRLGARGVEVVTYNFVYTEKKRRAPDKNDALEGCVRAVVRDVRARKGQAERALFLGGKSMGGRIASQVAAKDGGAIAGLVFLGYPLHPPGKPEQLRSAHLPKVPAPMLFVQGERDAFGTPTELAPILGKLTRGTRIHIVELGDHSLTVPKRLGVPQEEVLDRAADVIAGWMREVIG